MPGSGTAAQWQAAEQAIARVNGASPDANALRSFNVFILATAPSGIQP